MACGPLGESRDLRARQGVGATTVIDELGRKEAGAHQAPPWMPGPDEQDMADLVRKHAAERSTDIRRRQLLATDDLTELRGGQRSEQTIDGGVVHANRHGPGAR